MIDAFRFLKDGLFENEPEDVSRQELTRKRTHSCEQELEHDETNLGRNERSLRRVLLLLQKDAQVFGSRCAVIGRRRRVSGRTPVRLIRDLLLQLDGFIGIGS